MGGVKVAIIGAEALGALLATRMPGSYRKVIISPNKEAAVQIADDVGGIASDQISAVRGAQLILLTDGDVERKVEEMRLHLDEGALVVNMATDVMTGVLADRFPSVRFAAAKVVGHPREIGLGSPGVVVLDHITEEDEAVLYPILEGLGPVTRSDEERALKAEEIVAEVMTEAESRLRERLGELGLKEPAVRAAIISAGPGVLRDLSAQFSS